jgi:WD40 repeat protein
LEPQSNASGESSVSLWDLATQRRIAVTPEYAAGGVNAIDFTPDGSVLAAGHGWGDVSLLNVADLSPAGDTLEAPSGVSDVQFSPDGSVLATSSYESDDVLLWVPDNLVPEALSGHRGETVGLTFSSDGTRLATAGVDGRVNVWRIGPHHALRRDGSRLHDQSLAAVAYDGEDLVTVGQAAGTNGQAGGPQLVSWNTVSGGAGAALPIGEGVVALSRDGRLAAVGGDDGMISLIDARTGAEVGQPFSAHEGAVTAIAFDDDGSSVASAGCELPEPGTISCDGSGVAVWDIASARRVAGGRLDGESYVDRITFSPDGSMLAAAGASWKVSLWDVAANRPFGGQLDSGDRITDLAWTPDSRLLAVASAFGGAHAPGASQERNNKVVVWDVANRAPVGEPLLDHDSGVSAVAFSPDGAVLASGDYLGEIRLWDAETLSPLGDHIPTGSSVDVLRFGPDGATLASGHGDGSVQLWELSPEAWVEKLCAAAGRDLTEDEWAEFVPGAEYEPTCPVAGR